MKTFPTLIGLLPLMLAVPALSQAPNSNWDQIPIEAREVLTDTLLPRITTSDLVDLDGDGHEEIVLMSQSPLVSGPEATELSDLLFQSLLMIFQRVDSPDQTFPYKLSVLKSLTAPLPKPAHLSFQDMGGEPTPELIWLQGGPDSEGRYSEVLLYTYQSGAEDPLVEVARLSPTEGWIRIYDLDSDGISEVVSFAEADGQTYCRDLLFSTPSGWTTVLSETQKLGIPDILTFQQQNGLEPNGKISRIVFEKLKEILQIPRSPNAPVFDPSASPQGTVSEWEFVDQP